MSESNVVLGKEAMQGMMDGIKHATKAIRLSYGSKGVNAAIQVDLYPFNQTANDAKTIIQAIQVTDQVQKVGLDYLKELVDRQDATSGDGRKTSLIISESILEQALASGLSGMELKRELDALIPVIEKNIDDQKQDITVDDVYKVASIAGESKELGNLLGDIYKKIGKDGIIIPEGSGNYQTTFSVIEGVRFQGTGYLSPYLVYDEVAQKEGRLETKAIYENPIILVTKNKITKDSDIEPILNQCVESSRPLVIFTDDMDSGVAQRMIATHRAKVAKILIIKAPVLWKQYVFEDFAKVTGATIVEDSSGITFKTLKLDHLGTCGKITVTQDETIVLGTKDFTSHLEALKANDETDSKLRLSWLQTKTCILKLGANNESELSHLRLKCADAINSSQSALKGGVVAGGGVALLNASQAMPSTKAGEILAIALKEPLHQNERNMGIFVGTTLAFSDDIIDSAVVVKNAVRNAIALASIVLTTGIVITKPPKTPDQIAYEMLQNKGARF